MAVKSKNPLAIQMTCTEIENGGVLRVFLKTSTSYFSPIFNPLKQGS